MTLKHSLGDHFHFSKCPIECANSLYNSSSLEVKSCITFILTIYLLEIIEEKNETVFLIKTKQTSANLILYNVWARVK